MRVTVFQPHFAFKTRIRYVTICVFLFINCAFEMKYNMLLQNVMQQTAKITT